MNNHNQDKFTYDIIYIMKQIRYYIYAYYSANLIKSTF